MKFADNGIGCDLIAFRESPVTGNLGIELVKYLVKPALPAKSADLPRYDACRRLLAGRDQSDGEIAATHIFGQCSGDCVRQVFRRRFFKLCISHVSLPRSRLRIITVAVPTSHKKAASFIPRPL